MQSVSAQVGTYIIYGIVGIYAVVEKCCARRRPTYHSAGWEAVDLISNNVDNAAEYYQLDRTRADVVLHRIRKYHGLHAWDRTVVQWEGAVSGGYELDSVFESPRAPWFFIGYIENGVNVDCTESLSHIVVDGNRITTQLLQYLEPASADNVWIYVLSLIHI